ncbi:MAG: spermidine/putrescine ABC transporter substrate-binding protein [Coxiellaceae bacterium]|jgi:spermidine/putrescine transport system substrate-binding protein|nr:spermidine/putrescine ABC transporter substrate-binding protein [Coxiellaceae bacterium]
MKKYRYYIYIIYLLIITYQINSQAANLNIYIWGNYLPLEIVQQFTKETGIVVNITEYDNNETMFTKLKALKHSSYDIVVPSSYYVERMSKQGMLLRLNKTKLPNLIHLNPLLLNRDFDPKNIYSVPYLWGSTGITLNNKYFNKQQIVGWRNFWDKQYQDQLMIINDMRDVFSIGLLSLGYSVNDSNPEHIREAYLKLKQLLPNIKIFSIDTIPNIYIDEDAIIGMSWSGDHRLAKEENSNLEYIYPKEGFPLWIDNWAILRDAPNVEQAHKFINFMLRPKIAKQITIITGNATANKSAIKLLPKKLQYNHIVNPPQKIIRQGQIQFELDDKIRQLYEEYWELLKISN